MKVGDSFETQHGSKWTVTKVHPGGFEAAASDGVPHRFTVSGEFIREDYTQPHPYDYARPWSERETEDKAKAEKAKVDQAVADAEKKLELEAVRKSESEEMAFVIRRRQEAKKEADRIRAERARGRR